MQYSIFNEKLNTIIIGCICYESSVSNQNLLDPVSNIIKQKYKRIRDSISVSDGRRVIKFEYVFYEF